MRELIESHETLLDYIDDLERQPMIAGKVRRLRSRGELQVAAVTAVWAAVLGALTGGLVGFLASLASEPVQRWISGPELVLDYGKGDAYRALTDLLAPDPKNPTTQQKIGDAIYIRLRVKNVKPRIARACRAYLTRVEKEKPDGTYEDTVFKESIQLGWAAQGSREAGFGQLDIPRGIDQFIDIVRVLHPLASLIPQTQFPRDLDPLLAVPLAMYAHLWNYHGTYRMTVLVSGDGVNPVSRRVIVRWNGIWDQLDASDGGPGE